jgi:SnoaL-like polyketide cyclase
MSSTPSRHSATPSWTKSTGPNTRARSSDGYGPSSLICGWTVEAAVAEGDLVAARVLSEGTNLGPLNGVMPPTGKRFSAYQSYWYRIENGKLAEHWAVRDD